MGTFIGGMPVLRHDDGACRSVIGDYPIAIIEGALH